MSVGEIIIICVYALGLLATYHFQAKKINSLNTRIDTQEGMLKDVKTYMEIFDIKKIKETTQFLIDSSEKRASEEIEKLKHKLESKSSGGKKTFDQDHVEFVMLLARTVSVYAFSPVFDKAFEAMKDSDAKNLVKDIIVQYKGQNPISSLTEDQRIMLELLPFFLEQKFLKDNPSTEKIK